MIALATREMVIVPRLWLTPPALKDPEQALWSELRFSREPRDLFGLVVAAVDHCEGAHATRGETLRQLEATLGRWVGARLVIRLGGEPERYTLEGKYLKMRSPPALPAPPRKMPFPKRTQRQRLWSAMKVLRTFDLTTLLMTAEATRGATLDLLSILERGGWLRRTKTGWSTSAERQWGAVAPTIARFGDERGAVIRVTDQRDGTVIDLPPLRRGRRDRRQDSSNAGVVDGGVS